MSDMERYLVIGDLHGEFSRFQRLWRKVAFRAGQDRALFLGDYLDRGSGNVQVMDWVLGHFGRDDMVFLRGNHDQMLLDACRAESTAQEGDDWFDSPKALWLENGGSETDHQLYASGRREELLPAWLEAVRKMPLCWQETLRGRRYIFAHASVSRDPSVPLTAMAPEDFLWSRDLAFHREEYQREEIAVIGHTPLPALGLPARPQAFSGGKVLMMDTGSYLPGGCISCLDLLSGEVWQSDGTTGTGGAGGRLRRGLCGFFRKRH